MKPPRGLQGLKSAVGWGELNAALNALVREGVILSYSASAGTGAAPLVEVAICEGEDETEVVRRVVEVLPRTFSAAQVRTKTASGVRKPGLSGNRAVTIEASMAAPSNRFHRVEQAPPDAVTVELWSENGSTRGSVECPTGGMSGSLVPFVPPEAGMSAEEALATACHLANVDGREVVVVDRFDLWRSEWGVLD